ncbi:MAG: FHA domain-containing protein [Planctomycetaceae bacterium]|nr:FHA domain-containing protein [Planctomycetaceae bacterium]
MSSLFVIQGRDQGKRFELRDSVLGVGRDASSRIRLHDTEVSRRHAEIRQVDGGYQWIDLGSSNGSFVNSVRVDHQSLRSGDRVQIGRTLMIYTASFDSGASSVVQHDVDIVGNADGQSRIIKSVSHEEGSQFLSGLESTGSPWLARARSNLQIMYRTALAVSHTLDIDQLLQRIMELIFEWVEADRGCVMLIDRETDGFVPKVRRNRKSAADGQQADPDERMSISGTILDYVRNHQEGVLTSDAREDERWDPGASIVKLGVREAICVPMQGRYGMVGVIYIDTYTPPGRRLQQKSSNRFTDEHLKLMIAIAHQAALAVEDTSYYSAMLQAERLAAIGQTIAGLSHHVKNILQGIRGGSFLIEEGLKSKDWDVTGKGWGIVEKNQERISALVMDMLTFSKEREPEMVASDLNGIVGDVIELMQARAEQAEVRLLDSRSAGIPSMYFDPEGLHRAILNVVSNAIDASENVEQGKVEIKTEYQDDAGLLRVFVNDNGEGIDSDQLQRIFNVFVSGKGNRGTGLGLAVSQKILKEHNGEIRAESQPGQGSQFCLELPAVLMDRTAELSLPPQLPEDLEFPSEESE